MPRLLRAVIGLGLLGAGLYLGVRPIGRLPALGPLIDPAAGLWSTARAAEFSDASVTMEGMNGPVEVIVDDRGVPHIFAADELDGYRALGFLVARDRLFQLEIQSRAASGTLAELVGPAVLPIDRRARRLGFERLVERNLAAMDTTDPTYRAIAAYGQGINAWIDRMSPGELPLEFKLLGKRPTRWSEARSLLLFAQMSLVLADNDASLLKARAAARVGWPAADALFPVASPLQEPIQPSPDSLRPAIAAPLPPPGIPDPRSAQATGADFALGRLLVGDDAVRGSNNWAVAPGRTAGKQALLAGDPHLELTLPSIWYQAHLVVPDRLDVQGVTLPGAPWVVIGFNRSIAWSLTNTGADVSDYYRETVDDSIAPTRYRLDGAWKPLEIRVEVVRGPAGQVLAVDTVRFTHRGPLLAMAGGWLSKAWTVYGSRTAAGEFLAVNRARTAGEFLEATGTYGVPAQNMLVADRRGTIAIRSTGRYPVRPGDGRGDVIRNGDTTASDWLGDVPLEAYPFSLNPARGYLFSANQQPVDPAINPRFLGAHWPSPWRAMRIHRLLAADSAVTPEAMSRFQTDPVSERGLAFLRILLGKVSDTGRVNRAAPEVKAARSLLAEWQGSYDRNDRRAVLFEAVMAEMNRRTWDELADTTSGGSDEFQPPRPAEAVLLTLAADSASPWWDDRRTVAVERRDDIVEAALVAALDSVTRAHGSPSGDGWRWGAVHHANIYHLLRLPALSALGLEVDGGPSTLSPSFGDGTDGASWRMVVELGPTVRAWGIYPGGQSGNPASRHYRDLIPRWQSGTLDTLAFPSDPAGISADRAAYRLMLRPKGAGR